jgi:prevent-host-death family protein
MKSYSVAEAKAKFSEVLELAAAGEDVLVTKYGKPYVRLAVPQPAEQQAELKVIQKMDWDRLRKLRESMPQLNISAVDLVRQIREDGM